MPVDPLIRLSLKLEYIITITIGNKMFNTTVTINHYFMHNNNTRTKLVEAVKLLDFEVK